MKLTGNWRYWIVVALAAIVTACGGSGDGGPANPPANPPNPPSPPNPPTVQTVTVSPPGATLEVGQTMTFSAIARDSNGNAVAGATFTWSTSDATIASIAGNGVATGVAVGGVTIRATSAGVTSNNAALTVNTKPVTGPTSDELIAAALAAGTINAETALVYRAFANFGDARLPAQFRGVRADVFESTVIDEVLAAFDTLSTDAQKQLVPFLLRPASVGSWLDPNPPALAVAQRAARASSMSGQVRPQTRPDWCLGLMGHWSVIDTPTAPVRVWYDSRETGHNVVAAAVAGHVEATVWPMLFSTLGYKVPLNDTALVGCDGGNDKLDIYIVRPDSMDELGKTLPENSPSYDRNRAATHIRIKSSLGPEVLEHTVAHEIAHATHYAYPTAASQTSYGWFRDAFANWAALQVYPKNTSIVNGASCFFDTPETSLDDVSVIKCPAITRPVSRVYGAYLPLEAISWKKGVATIKRILETTATASTAYEAMDTVLAGTTRVDWGLYAQALWNQDVIQQRADSFFKRQNMSDAPKLAKDLPNPVDANLGANTYAETLLDARVNNMAVKFYHFTFNDTTTRSLMFHNTWRQNKRDGEKVSVFALWKAEGKPWVEEDLIDYEWIGFCRDQKDQRLEKLVLVVASAEWRGSNPVVVAAKQPRVMRNNIGCWGYTGTTKRTYASKSWAQGGATVTTFNARYDYHPGGTPIQYTDLSTGRLRIPIVAPLFAGGALIFNEAYSESSCSYAANVSASESTVVLGGNSAGTIVINNFMEALPDDLRAEQAQLTGTAERAYIANGVTDRTVNGSVSGAPSCGTTYTTAVGAWLLTRDSPSTSEHVASDGHLRGSWTATAPSDSSVEVYDWDLAPVREP